MRRAPWLNSFNAFILLLMLAACGLEPVASESKRSAVNSGDATRQRGDATVAQKSNQSKKTTQTQADRPSQDPNEQAEPAPLLAASQLEWDGRTFLGDAELTLFPIE